MTPGAVLAECIFVRDLEGVWRSGRGWWGVLPEGRGVYPEPPKADLQAVALAQAR